MPACPRSREGSSSSRNGADCLGDNRGFCCVDEETRTASWPGLREGNGAAKGLLAGGEEPPAFSFSSPFTRSASAQAARYRFSARSFTSSAAHFNASVISFSTSSPAVPFCRMLKYRSNARLSAPIKCTAYNAVSSSCESSIRKICSVGRRFSVSAHRNSGTGTPFCRCPHNVSISSPSLMRA